MLCFHISLATLFITYRSLTQNNNVVEAFFPAPHATAFGQYLNNPNISHRSPTMLRNNDAHPIWKPGQQDYASGRGNLLDSVQLKAFPLFDASYVIEPYLPIIYNSKQWIGDACASTSLLLNEDPNSHGGALTNMPAIDNLIGNPSFWAVDIMLSIVGLLYVWEESIRTLQKNIPKAFQPVIDSMLAEVGGLGFIGLFLEIFVTRDPDHGLGFVVGYLSERFLGEKEILLEAFESLHSTFFEVGVSYFLVTGVIVGAVLTRVNELSQISELVLDTDGDGKVSLEELADALNAEVVIVDSNGDGVLSDDEITNALRQIGNRGFFGELSLSVEQRASEILLLRERLLAKQNLPESFLVEKYFEQIFAHNLEEMVELSPLTWLPLIPLISVLDAVDLSNEVVSAASSNAAISCGCFVTSPWFFFSSLAAQMFSLGWCIYNFWKLTSVKNMLIPTLVRDRFDSSDDHGQVIVLPPRYEDEALICNFNSSPMVGANVERFFGGIPGTNNHERLFGAAGAEGKNMFRNSIKIHTWFCVSQIIFLFVQIVERDVKVLFDYNTGVISAENIGNLAMLVPELNIYSAFVALNVAQLFLAPTVFLTYCTATSIEEMTFDWAIRKTKIESKELVDDETLKSI